MGNPSNHPDISPEIKELWTSVREFRVLRDRLPEHGHERSAISKAIDRLAERIRKLSR